MHMGKEAAPNKAATTDEWDSVLFWYPGEIYGLQNSPVAHSHLKTVNFIPHYYYADIINIIIPLLRCVMHTLAQ